MVLAGVAAALAGASLIGIYALFGDDTVRRATYDEARRLVAYPGKVEVPCPAAGPDTAVILAIGQSNIGNHLEKRVTSQHRGAVVNLFGGKCYSAASPLLGASGEEGEFLTLLGDRLVDDGAYRAVVIVASAIGATAIAKWRKGGALNGLVRDVLTGLPSGYQVTQVLWLQGEADHADSTSAEDYTAAFRSLLETLADGGVAAPVFLSVATRCVDPWKADNPVAAAQRALVDGRHVFLAADIDALVGDADRRSDRCHFAASGQEKAASAFAAAIERVRKDGAPRSAAPSPSGRPSGR